MIILHNLFLASLYIFGIVVVASVTYEVIKMGKLRRNEVELVRIIKGSSKYDVNVNELIKKVDEEE